MARSRLAKELIARLEREYGRSCDPLELLLRVSQAADKPWDMRVDCAKAALPFVYPKLANMQVTGKDEGPIQLEAVNAIRDNPELARKAEELYLAMLSLPAARAELPAAPETIECVPLMSVEGGNLEPVWAARPENEE